MGASTLDKSKLPLAIVASLLLGAATGGVAVGSATASTAAKIGELDKTTAVHAAKIADLDRAREEHALRLTELGEIKRSVDRLEKYFGTAPR